MPSDSLEADSLQAWGRTVTVRLRRVATGTDGVAAEAFSVEGLVVTEDGRNAVFAGWVGLVNQLERLLAAAPADRLGC
jgi:hypothetical protein